MKAAIFDRFLYCREPGLPRIIHNSRRAGDRVDRHATDTCDAPQLFFDPVSAEDREQVANFERGSCHECLFPRLVSEVLLRTTATTCVFLDIGGVLLIDGWEHHARKRAATNFKLELAEMEDRHHLIFKRTRRAS
jgi:hypothetical protein